MMQQPSMKNDDWVRMIHFFFFRKKNLISVFPDDQVFRKMKMFKILKKKFYDRNGIFY